MTTRVLLLSSLYPNSVQPGKGQFVRERVRQIRKRYDLEWHIIAPVPWFPLTHEMFGSYAEFAQVPYEEQLEEDFVLHPRYVQVPKVGDALSPISYAKAVARCIRRHAIEFDVIDAHFFFPDGVAATLLGREFRKPVVVTARGSDINLMPDELAAGRWIRWAARFSDRLIAVSEPLAERLEQLSGGREVVRAPNGVDTERFRPVDDRALVREKLGLGERVVLSAGNLIPLKGHDLVIEAITGIPDTELVVAGDGPCRNELESLAIRLGVSKRVRFTGQIDQERLIEYYCAADVLALASSSEGSPNVVLEALACGTPVVATVASASPHGTSGEDVTLVDRSAHGIGQALRQHLMGATNRSAIRSRAESLGWGRTCASIARVLTDLGYRTIEAAA